MSKLFFDDFVDLSDLEYAINEVSDSEDERHELWKVADELVHHHVLGCVFDHLPEEFHEEFLQKYHENPADDLLVHFINTKASIDFTEIVASELQRLQKSVLSDLIISSSE
jgi:hypothetical protein